MPIIELEQSNDFNVFKDAGAVFWFSAPWCVPCRQITPAMNQIATTRTIVKVDIDKFPEVASNYEVMSIPTIIDFRNNETKESVGVKPKALLVKEFAV